MFLTRTSSLIGIFTLLAQHVVADRNMAGPGHVLVRTNGLFQGCLDESMKWVVDGSLCGIFTAKTSTGPSK